MSNMIFTRWMDRYDPLRGRSKAALLNGLLRSCGRFWLRVGGGVNAYRGDAGGEIDYSAPIGAAGPQRGVRGKLRTFPWVAWPTGQYDVVLKAVGCGGVEESSENRIRIVIDSVGASEGSKANAPSGLSAKAIAGGKIRLAWRYCSAGSVGIAAEFRVYSDEGSGSVNYAAPIATVTAAGDRWYSWTSSAYANNSAVKFVVRTANPAGGEESNEITVSAVADADAPRQITGGMMFIKAER